MKCDRKDIKELLPLFLERALEGAVKKRVEDHIGGCADCREELVLLGAMAAEPVPDPGEEFWSRMPSRIYHQVRQRAEEHTHRAPSGFLQFFVSFRWAWAAATVLMIAALSLFLSRPLPEAPTVAVAPPALTLEDEFLPAETVDVASLSAGEIRSVDSWADREMETLTAEAGAVMTNGKDTDIYEELAELDGTSLERLSRMLDRLEKGGQV